MISGIPKSPYRGPANKLMFVHPTAIVEENVKIGENTKIWHFAHIRRNASIGRSCVIGKGVYIDEGVKIGNRVKIQNFVSVYKGVTVEDDVFIGPHATFTNDKYPRAFGERKLVKTLIKRGASIGANATIVCGITLGEYSMVAAGAVVTKDVPPFGLVLGVPAKLKGFVCKRGHPMKKKEEFEDRVIFRCDECDEEISVPKKFLIRLVRKHFYLIS